jgi:N-acetylglucosaminyldiphosphoundecaprenol N-acetyl-beta-D-mannosaminyltransferase
MVRRPCAAINVLGVRIDAINMAQALRIVDSSIMMGHKGYICVTGVHGVMEAQKDLAFKRLLNASLLTTPDGMPTVWLGKLSGHAGMDRVYGPDFMNGICAMSVETGYSHFLYGGREGVAERLKQVLTHKFPGLKVVGTYTPPFRRLTPAEDAELLDKLSVAKPDILWVGLSTPKQEWFMAEYARKTTAKLMIGVGAAFDFHTGATRDAPDWIKKAGLQWLHRLYQEPTRLWRRYLFNNSAFIAHIALQLLGMRKYPLEFSPIND